MKLVNKILEFFANPDLGERGTQAGRTSFDAGHAHEVLINKTGDGHTVKTIGYDGVEYEADHIHYIVNHIVQKPENEEEEFGHTHSIEA
jgi:hypothetical protein